MTPVSYNTVILLKLQLIFTALTPFSYTIYTKAASFDQGTCYFFRKSNFRKSTGIGKLMVCKKELALEAQ